MKKIIKIAEAREIIANNPQLDPDDLMYGIEWLNKGEAALSCMTKAEANAVALYLITREINNEDLGGCIGSARHLCHYIEDLMVLPFGYCIDLVRGETTRQNRILIAELNMGLNHITLTQRNPYAKNLTIIAN